MSGSEHARPVWPDQRMRDMLHDAATYDGGRFAELHDLVDEWDAAPADPTEAVRQGLRAGIAVWTADTPAAVLRALGHPKEPA